MTAGPTSRSASTSPSGVALEDSASAPQGAGRGLDAGGQPGLLARGARYHLHDLQARLLVFRHPRGRATWRLTGPGERRGRSERVWPLQRQHGAGFAQAVLAGLGIALLPSTMTRRDLRAGRMVPVLPQYHRAGHGVNLVYPSRRHLPLAVSAFIDLVVDKLGAVEELPMVAECRPVAPA